AVGLCSESKAACWLDFLGSCRELTADFLFCKAEIQRVSSQLHFQISGSEYRSTNPRTARQKDAM
ncbi:MAG: hypothetical protein WBC04_24840, partial [Candidatus Acidiferrales bacterium]